MAIKLLWSAQFNFYWIHRLSNGTPIPNFQTKKPMPLIYFSHILALTPIMCMSLSSYIVFMTPLTVLPRISRIGWSFSSRKIIASRYSSSPRTLTMTFLISTSFGIVNDSLSFTRLPKTMEDVPLLKPKRIVVIVSMAVHSILLILISRRRDSFSNYSRSVVLKDSNWGHMDVLTTTRWFLPAPNNHLSFLSSLTAWR